MTPVLSIAGLEVSLGGRRVLRGVGLALERGTITSLLGPNGAGKSTLLRAVLGVLPPAAGSVRVLGRDPRRGAARRAIGYVPDQPDAYPWMTARDLYRLVGPQHPGWDAERALQMAARLGVPLGTELARLSRGQGAKLMLTAALAHRPALLLLDEPFGGLDPGARDELLAALFSEVELEDLAVLVATHDLEVAARVSDRVALLEDGRLSALGTLEQVGGARAPARGLRALFPGAPERSCA